MGNVVFLFASSSRRFIKNLGRPVTGRIWSDDGAPLQEGFPKYLVEPVEYGMDDMFLDQIQLLDFGQGTYHTADLYCCFAYIMAVVAFFISSPPKVLRTPISFHPPELVFGQALTEAVDIWNLGCTVRSETQSSSFIQNLSSVKTYELVTTCTPFEAAFHDKDMIPQFHVIIGGVPEEWIQDGDKTNNSKGIKYNP